MVGAGDYKSVKQAKKLIKIKEHVLPTKGLVEKHEEKYQIFREFYPVLKEIWK